MDKRRLAASSLRAVARHRLRSGLMMLGTVVGVGALVFVLTVGGAAERKLLATVRQLFGASSIVVSSGGGFFMGGPRGAAERLTLDDVEAVVAELPQVDDWDPLQALPAAEARYGERSTSVRLAGQSERSTRVWDRGAARGEYFDAAAVAGSARVAVIGETVVRELFGEQDPLGAEIRVGAVPLRVIGVLEPFGTDIHGMDRDNEIVVPITTAMRRILNVDTIRAAKLLVRDGGQVGAVAEQVARLLRTRHGLQAGQADDFTVVTSLAVGRMVARVERILFLYLPLVAAVSLLAGGAVAAGLMLLSVNERVGEIGLRRALGARPADIRLQFLLETAVTALGGGLLGVALGTGVAWIVAGRLGLSGAFSPLAIGVGLALATAVGLVAGVLPARRAAALQPSEALR